MNDSRSRAVFIAYVVAGMLIAAIAYLISFPITRTELFQEVNGIQPVISLPPWPNHLVVWPSIPLGGMWALAWTLFAGGALGLCARLPRWAFAGIALVIVVLAVLGWVLSSPWEPQHMAVQLASIHESSAQILVSAPPPPHDRILLGFMPLGFVLGGLAIALLFAILGIAARLEKSARTLSIGVLSAALLFGIYDGALGPDLYSRLIAAAVMVPTTVVLVAIIAVPIALLRR